MEHGSFIMISLQSSRWHLFYEQRKLQGEDLEMILKGFLHVIEEMAEFLLNTEQLVLCPEYIFLDVEKKEVSFCCLPDYHRPVQEQFRELTEYLLPKLDHEDPTADKSWIWNLPKSHGARDAAGKY